MQFITNKRQGPLIFFILSTVMILLGYSFLRLSFYVWNWHSFESSGIWEVLKALMMGLRFDLVSCSILLIPIFLFSFIASFMAWRQSVMALSWVVVFIHIPFLVFNIIDIEFFNFTGRRLTVSGLVLFQEAKGKGLGFLTVNWGGILAGLIFLWIWSYLYLKVIQKVFNVKNKSTDNLTVQSKSLKSEPKEIQSDKKWKLTVSHFPILLGLVIGARGGVQSKPIDFVDGAVFNTPIMNNLVLNSTFSLVKSVDKDTLPHVQYFSNTSEFVPILNGSSALKSLWTPIQWSKPQNVVIILLEGFSYEYMGKPHGDQGYTPFLDELSQRSLAFKNAYANGRRSIEGVSSILAGIPALMNEAFITSEFASNYFVGAGTLFNQKGYHTSFFHGGNNGTMYFDRFTESAGIQYYFGSNEYPANDSDHDQVWGIYDGPFFDFFGKKLSSFPRPFFSMIFTLSSHHPYKIPKEFQGRFKKGPIEILESIQYADHVLKDFFQDAEKTDWYKDTLFIITADHTQKSLRPEYESEVGRFRVPILFFHPSIQWPKLDLDTPIQHIDILPSILEILNITNDHKILLSESVFRDVPNRSVLIYNDRRHFQITKDFISVRAESGKISHYRSPDTFLRQEVTSDLEATNPLDKKLKASIQYFNQGLWDNRLYFPSK